MSAEQQEKKPRFQVGDHLVLANNNPTNVLVQARRDGLRPVGLPATVRDVLGHRYYGCVIEGVPGLEGGVYQIVCLQDLSKRDTLIRRYKPNRRVSIEVERPHYSAWSSKDVYGKQGYITDVVVLVDNEHSETRTGLDLIVRLDDYPDLSQTITPEDIDFI